jgi:hypothetical protein
MPMQDSLVTVGDIVDSSTVSQDPEPFMRSLTWGAEGAELLESTIDTVRSLVSPGKREMTSSATLRSDLKDVAYDVGVELLDYRDADRAMATALEFVQSLIARLEAVDQRWDVILPLVNLQLRIRGRAIQIGPVLLVRDPSTTSCGTAITKPTLPNSGNSPLRDSGRRAVLFEGIWST